MGNTAANRRLTFGMRGPAGLARQLALGTLVYAITLGLTLGAVAVLHGLVARPSSGAELAVLIVASTGATVTRYFALRSWVFVHRAHRTASPTELPSRRPPSPADLTATDGATR